MTLVIPIRTTVWALDDWVCDGTWLAHRSLPFARLLLARLPVPGRYRLRLPFHATLDSERSTALQQHLDSMLAARTLPAAVVPATAPLAPRDDLLGIGVRVADPDQLTRYIADDGIGWFHPNLLDAFAVELDHDGRPWHWELCDTPHGMYVEHRGVRIRRPGFTPSLTAVLDGSRVLFVSSLNPPHRTSPVPTP